MKTNCIQKIILIPLLAFTSILISVCVICGCSNKTIEPKSFAFDSWDTIAAVAEGGLDNLIETYNPIGGTFIIQDLNDENERLAKTKQINLEGIGNYKVRVIAENQDVRENGKLAPLTFEFTKVVNNVAYSKPGVQSNNWENSELRYFLNNNLLKMFPPDLQRAIKTVKKDTCIGGKNEQVKTTSEKVFTLSVSEINATSDINVIEGTAYTLYKDNKYSPGDKNDPRVKDDKSYWLRSPMPQNSINAFNIRVGKDEGFYSQVCYDDASESMGVIPCFCI